MIQWSDFQIPEKMTDPHTINFNLSTWHSLYWNCISEKWDAGHKIPPGKDFTGSFGICMYVELGDLVNHHQNIPKPRGFSEKKMASNQKNSGESQTFRETSIIFLIFFGSSEASRGWPLNRDNKCTAADCLLQQRTAEARLVSMSHISRHLWSLDNSETPDAAMISTTIATTSHDLWRCHDDSWWEGMVCREQHLRQKNRTQTGGILVSGAKHTCIMPPPLCSSSHEDPWVKLKDALSKSSSSSIEHTQLD